MSTQHLGQCVQLIAVCALAVKAHNAARASRRRNIKFADLEMTARGDRRLVEMGLSDAFSTEHFFAEARGEVAGKTQPSADKKGPQGAQENSAAKQTRPITSFFS